MTMVKNGAFRGSVRRVFSLFVLFALVVSPLTANRGFVQTAYASEAPLAPKVAVGGGHSLALKDDGTVWAWGDNEFGQLGTEGPEDKLVPGQVEGLSGIVDIAGGYAHSVALDEEGNVWTWGRNEFGQLGDGTKTDRFAPAKVPGIEGVTAIASGDYRTLALGSDGSVWSWGSNESGQLGDGTAVQSSSVPVKAKGFGPENPATAIAGGNGHTVVLASDGTVWTWGYNAFGQLGDGTKDNRSAPIQVTLPGSGKAIAVAAGTAHSAVLEDDGTVWIWGSNSADQLGGDDSVAERLSPAQVEGIDDVVSIAVGRYHTIALKNDGTVWTWGKNDVGQLGNGDKTIASNPTPTQTSVLTDVVAIAKGSSHNIALKNDGTVWTWGFNRNGQLGDGKRADQYTPSPVAGLKLKVPVLTLDSYDFTLAKESTKQLKVKASYADGTTEDVTAFAVYESSDPATASVSATGLVKGLTAGKTATVTAVYEGREVSAAVEVTAEIPVLTLDSYDFTLAKGSTKQLAVTAGYADGTTKNVTAFTVYVSSDPRTASVSAAGLVKALTAGQTTVITATYEKQSVSAAVRVASPPETPVISLNGYDLSVVQGDSKQLIVTASYGDGRREDVTSLSEFQSSVPEAVSVSSSGLVTGLSSGQQAIITVTYRGQTLSASVHVTSPPEAPVVALNGYDFTLAAGSVKQLLVTASDADGGTEDVTALATFRSSAPAVASVSADGLVTAIAAGQTTVTAAYLGQSVSATVHVTANNETGSVSTGEGMPPLIRTFDPPDWMSGQSPSYSWNTAVGRDEATDEVVFRLNSDSTERLAKTAPANTKVWTVGVKQGGSASLIVPFSAVKAAFDVSGRYGAIAFATEAGSFSLPLSVLEKYGALNGEGNIRLSISPSAEPTLQADGVTFLAPPVTFELTVTSGGSNRTVGDFGDVFAVCSFPVPTVGNVLLDSDHTSVFYGQKDGDGIGFAPARFFKNPDGVYYAIVSRSGTGTYAAGYKKTTFLDSGGHWAGKVIDKLAAKGLISGRTELAFVPDGYMTRAEFASLLVKGLGLQDQRGAGAFRDVDGLAWYAKDVLIANAKSLLKGKPDGSFRPNAPITRQEMAVIVANALRYVKPQEKYAETSLASFVDADRVPEWAEEAIRIAVGAKIVNGDGAGRLNPGANATRAQAAVIAERLLQKLGFMD